jgi:DNA (cytosine-5)-methyltransferase 1
MRRLTLDDHDKILALIKYLRSLGQPLCLDAYCCQGGASQGYAYAGFTVLGVDIDPQPRYPFAFVQADALEFIRRYGHLFDFVHASPPCQRYSATQRINGNDHPDLIGPTREALEAVGVPWVLENVMDAAPELRNPVMLCGAVFGLHTYRHRLFEPGGWALPTPTHPAHTHSTVKMGRPLAFGDFYHAVGNFTNVEYVRRDLGMPWASRDGLRECIPPAYSEWVGRSFTNSLEKVA